MRKPSLASPTFAAHHPPSNAARKGVTPHSARPRSEVILREKARVWGSSHEALNLPGQPRLCLGGSRMGCSVYRAQMAADRRKRLFCQMFDDSCWPDIILISWPAVYWTVSRVLLP